MLPSGIQINSALTAFYRMKKITGKLYTQRIERENMNFRNRLKWLNRKTLGYSKSSEMHEKIIGTFIEHEH